ncbi:unnamed protein product [Calicophoron daubneyi]|uniref:Caprin-1 dimerization domain-containing protein n=1 Tax=Calicophoron daubneyi TaxID=300641 RepID=A0AAV2T0D9_CALDB
MSSRSSELVRQFEANFERKQRNLAKRKSKLDTYREKLAKGEVLNEEQRKAVDGYDGVIQSIAVLQEFITQTKELVEDVEKAAKEDEGQIESAHEEYTVSFLHIHGCLMRLLGALDCPPVRVAVVRCSSENHLRLLDIVKGLVTAPLLDNWPGTSTNSLVNAPSFLQNHPDLESVARNTFDFVTGRPVPIASPEDQPGSHKKYYNFKDARSLCFRLLATPVVQRAMGMPSRPASVASSSKEEINENVDESYKQAHVESESVHVRDDTPIAIPAGDTNNYETDLNVPIQHDVLEQPVQDAAMSVAVDQMIKPLGGTFNFLQFSNVLDEGYVRIKERFGMLKRINPASPGRSPFVSCLSFESFMSS